MIDFKACPRCKGDVYEDRDEFGPFKSCLQCGYCLDLPSDAKSQEGWPSVALAKVGLLPMQSFSRRMQRQARVEAILKDVNRVHAD
ncbi:MAG: hypothetical protein HY531_02775 [Chloroflexi bacterium]|nr:hypothetical protein [Chloroflexota bacterium]